MLTPVHVVALDCKTLLHIRSPTLEFKIDAIIYEYIQPYPMLSCIFIATTVKYITCYVECFSVITVIEDTIVMKERKRDSVVIHRWKKKNKLFQIYMK